MRRSTSRLIRLWNALAAQVVGSQKSLSSPSSLSLSASSPPPNAAASAAAPLSQSLNLFRPEKKSSRKTSQVELLAADCVGGCSGFVAGASLSASFAAVAAPFSSSRNVRLVVALAGACSSMTRCSFLTALNNLTTPLVAVTSSLRSSASLSGSSPRLDGALFPRFLNARRSVLAWRVAAFASSSSVFSSFTFFDVLLSNFSRPA
mmetsp:Transcript_4182/g.8616  ORF Transcript_4182/g.8616 Transcript_4182/m.8616 type:complete len:205 (+) Transcript_4182:140-754(+)